MQHSRGLRSVLLISLVVLFMNFGYKAQAEVILDALGTVTPTTTFSVFGSGGTSISGEQSVGPAFTLTVPTVITEIGGFVNNCRSIINGQPMCPNRLPFLIQIGQAVDGSFVSVGQFALPLDVDPLTVTYEAVDPNLLLNPGSYFALFVAQGQDAGELLGNAEGGTYVADTVLLGVDISGRFTEDEVPAAVRILGATVPEPDSLLLLLSALGLIYVGVKWHQAIFDKTGISGKSFFSADQPPRR
jgi:hypothetical protein